MAQNQDLPELGIAVPVKARAPKQAKFLFDRPVWRDWCFWLGLLGVAAGTETVSMSDGGAAAINLVLASAFQFALFGCLPAWLRRGWRRRRLG